ncbi:MAG TPA: ComF family protein [Gammaproteobacteria bacterium]|nr:ComF family protein [Gammaproteobacteria bacterium]
MVHGWAKFNQILYPPYCLLCRGPARDQALCDACHADLPWQQHTCPCCALPLNQTAVACGTCLQQPPPFDRAIAPLHSAWPLDRLLTKFKFSHRLSHGRLLARLLAQHISQPQLPDAIVPVPLHDTRLRQRGFNQAAELARGLGQQLGLPVLNNACFRQRETDSQSSLSATARRQNMHRAFVVKGKLTGHLAIVDDVMTTGSTVAELAKALKQAGAEKISVWCVARA